MRRGETLGERWKMSTERGTFEQLAYQTSMLVRSTTEDGTRRHLYSNFGYSSNEGIDSSRYDCPSCASGAATLSINIFTLLTRQKLDHCDCLNSRGWIHFNKREVMHTRLATRHMLLTPDKMTSIL